MTRPSPSPARALAAVLATVAATLLALGASPAAAHGGDGEMELVSATRGDGDAVELVIRLTYVDDGHGVPDATVTAVVGDDAATPLTAGDEEGIYQGTVDAPPGSTIRVTSVEPVVTLEVAAPSDDPTTTDGTTTTAPTTATPTTAAPTTAAPTTDGDGTTTTAPEGTAVLVEEDDGLSTGAVVAIAGGTAAVAAVGVWAALTYGRRRPQDGPDGTPGPDGAGPPAGP